MGYLRIRRESYVERVFVEGIAELGGWAPKLVSPGTAGMPDRLALLPPPLWRPDRLLVELKDGEDLDPLQEVIHARLARIGYPVQTLRSADEVRAWLRTIRR